MAEVEKQQRVGSSQELSEMLGVSVETLRSLVKRKVLRSPKGHTWDFVKSCRDIRNNMNRGVAWERACAFLSGLERKEPADGEGGASAYGAGSASKVKSSLERMPQSGGRNPHETKPAPAVVAVPAAAVAEPEPVKRGRGRPKKAAPVDADTAGAEIANPPAVHGGKLSGFGDDATDGIGIEAAVGRLRVLEQRLHEKLNEAVVAVDLETAEEFPRRFKVWTVAIEQLRKMEADLLDVLEHRQELIRVADVREWAVRNAQGVKQRFLGLPALLAPKLDRARWQVIQEQMEGGIRHVLGELSVEPKG